MKGGCRRRICNGCIAGSRCVIGASGAVLATGLRVAGRRGTQVGELRDERVADRPGRRPTETCAGDYYHIDVGRELGVPKAVPDDALDPVAVHCARQRFPRDRETEPAAVSVSAGRRDDREEPVSASAAVTKNPGELRREQQPTLPREAPAGRFLRTGQWELRGVALGNGRRPLSVGDAIDPQGVSRARPLARRAWRTLRPFRVAFRARKPWVRARFTRLGLNVCFTSYSCQGVAGPVSVGLRSDARNSGSCLIGMKKTVKSNIQVRPRQCDCVAPSRHPAVDNHGRCG